MNGKYILLICYFIQNVGFRMQTKEMFCNKTKQQNGMTVEDKRVGEGEG